MAASRTSEEARRLRSPVTSVAHTHPLSVISALSTVWVVVVGVVLLLQRLVMVIVESPARDVSWLTVAYGLRRRLDDASFWGMFCVFIAGTLTLRAALRIESHPSSAALPRSRWTWLVALPVAGIPIAIYLWYVSDQAQTFWYDGVPAKMMAQRIEGALVVTVIVVAALVFAVHIAAVRRLRFLINEDADDESGELHHAAGLLVSVAAGPQVSAGVGFALYSILAFVARVAGWPDGRPTWLGHGASDVKKLVLSLTLYGLFFVIVGLYAWWRLGVRVVPLTTERFHATYPCKAASWLSTGLYMNAWKLVDRVLLWVSIITVIVPIGGVARAIAALVASWEPFQVRDRRS